MTPINPNPIFPPGYPESLPSAEVRRRFLALLGETFEPTVPLDLQVTDETILPGDIIRQRLTYQVAPGETVPAYHPSFAPACPRTPPASSPSTPTAARR